MAITSPRAVRLPWHGVALTSLLLIWIVLCANLLPRTIQHPGIVRITLCVALVLAPLLLLKIARVPVYFLALYAAVIPFENLLSTGGAGTVTKLVAISTGVSLILSMIGMHRAILPSRALFVVLALMAYIGATVFWAIDPAYALTIYFIYVQYFALFVVISIYPIEASDLKLILASTIVGALLVAGYGDYTFWNSNANRLLIETDTYAIDPNEYAAALIAPFALTLMMFLRGHFSTSKCLWLGATALLFSAIAISGSRGAAFAVIAVLIFLLLRTRYRKQLLSISGALIIAAMVSPIAARFATADAGTGDGRVDIWKVGIASLHRYWLGGAGVGNFQNAFTEFFLTTPHAPLPWARTGHSLFVQSAVEYGIIGFALVMAVWYFQFRELVSVRVDDRMSDLCTALSAAVLGLFVAGFSLDLMMYKYTWIVFSLIALTRTVLIRRGIVLSGVKPADAR